MRLQVVSDVDTAMAVLRASIFKGEALERPINDLKMDFLLCMVGAKGRFTGAFPRQWSRFQRAHRSN
jgi:hypothetical protein